MQPKRTMMGHNTKFDIPKEMGAWVLSDPNNIQIKKKPVPEPKEDEVLLKIDAVAICATDLEIIAHGKPAQIEGQMPFNKNYTPGHEAMGRVVKLGSAVDNFKIGDRVAVEIHAGCSRCEMCVKGWYTACLNYGFASKGHKANGFTTDGAFAEYMTNRTRTLVKVPDDMSDEEATLAVTAGTSMYTLDVMGGLFAGQTMVITGPGPIGLCAVGVASALGAEVILTGTRDNRLETGKKLGATHVINVTKENAVEKVRRLTDGIGAHYVLECSGAANAINDAGLMIRRGGKIGLAAFPSKPVEVDIANLVRNNAYIYATRGEGKSACHRAMALMAKKRFDAKLIHTHTFAMKDLQIGLKYTRERIEDAIKVVVRNDEKLI
jgi:2-desacetyl-2-hydroxyethyl bacteriochlorophyllide A dehydrogenase